jgi:hypothetical protein
MIEAKTEVTHKTMEDSFRLYAEKLQFWRLCRHASCFRARACRGDALLCCRRFAAWAEAVKEAAMRERYARDPATEALRLELGQRLGRLSETLRNEP